MSPIGPDELPPPYSTVSGGVPMVSCRVCGNMIDISGKKDQVSRIIYRSSALQLRVDIFVRHFIKCSAAGVNIRQISRSRFHNKIWL